MLIIALLFVLSIASARADEMTGNEMLSLCETNPSFVIGYVTGVTEGASRGATTVITKFSVPPAGAIKTLEDAVAWSARLKTATNEIEGYCIPDGVIRAQSKDVVCKYLKDNPAGRHLSGAFLVRAALSKAWPCADK